ncbi:MAG: hypothetical protein ACR2QO_14390, partial [Acidimicrobiales bacterium]
MRVRNVRAGAFFGAVVAAALIATACSGSGSELEIDQGLVGSSSSTGSTATTTPSTATAEPETTTSLSEAAAAEAEVTRLVEEWWVEPFDTSLGQEGLALEKLDGLIRQRRIDRAAQR